MKNIKNYQPKVEIQEKNKNTPENWEREREREHFFLWGKTMRRMEEVGTNL